MKQKRSNVNIFNYPAKKYSSWMFDETLKYQKQYGFDIGRGEHATWNNEADAFKHVFMQAHLSLLFGRHAAKFVGDWHERDGNLKMGQTSGEFYMDNWNNAQGREIAKEIIREYGVGAIVPSENLNKLIVQKVMQRMKDGKLITNPNECKKFQQGRSTGFAVPIVQAQNKYQKIFTPEEIGKMTKEEFAQNESIIMEQVRKGLVTNQPPKFDYGSYKNPESGNERIFTREDIGKMSGDEYAKYEKEITAQLNSIGIPNEKDLPSNIKTFEKEKSQRINSTDPQDGRWVTINGNHVFIEKD